MQARHSLTGQREQWLILASMATLIKRQRTKATFIEEAGLSPHPGVWSYRKSPQETTIDIELINTDKVPLWDHDQVAQYGDVNGYSKERGQQIDR